MIKLKVQIKFLLVMAQESNFHRYRNEKQPYEESINLVKSLGFFPKRVDSFNYQLFDEDGLRLHVMNCTVGALLCFQKTFEK